MFISVSFASFELTLFSLIADLHDDIQWSELFLLRRHIWDFHATKIELSVPIYSNIGTVKIDFDDRH